MMIRSLLFFDAQLMLCRCYLGTWVGTVAALLVDSANVLIAVPVCMVAVPCAFIPATFTFTKLASMIFALGGAATSPVFFACLCSYITGFGVLHDLAGVNKRGTESEEDEVDSLGL